jgi:predicted N-formylglutamate amidohydrolase
VAKLESGILNKNPRGTPKDIKVRQEKWKELTIYHPYSPGISSIFQGTKKVPGRKCTIFLYHTWTHFWDYVVNTWLTTNMWSDFFKLAIMAFWPAP